MTWCEHLAKVLAPSALQLVGPRPHPTPPPPLAMARVMYWWVPLMQAALQATPLLPWSRRCNGKPVDIVDGAALAASSDAKRTQTKCCLKQRQKPQQMGPTGLACHCLPTPGHSRANSLRHRMTRMPSTHSSRCIAPRLVRSAPIPRTVKTGWLWPHCQAAATGCNHSPCMPSSGG